MYDHRLHTSYILHTRVAQHSLYFTASRLRCCFCCCTEVQTASVFATVIALIAHLLGSMSTCSSCFQRLLFFQSKHASSLSSYWIARLLSFPLSNSCSHHPNNQVDGRHNIKIPRHRPPRLLMNLPQSLQLQLLMLNQVQMPIIC